MRLSKRKVVSITLFLALLMKLISDYQTNINGQDVTFWGRLATLALYLFMVVFVVCNWPSSLELPGRKWRAAGALLLFWGVTAFTSYIVDGYVLHVNFKLVILVVILFLCEYDDEQYANMIRLASLFLALHCAVSLIAMFQGNGFEMDYDGIFPFLSIRLSGTQSHANPFGGIAAATALTGAYFANPLVFLLGVVACVFSQSKAALGGMVIAIIILFYDKAKKIKGLRFLSVILIIGGVLLNISNILDNFDFSFTGRTTTWQLFFQEWIKTPKSIIFGIAQSTVSAHNYCENQYIQSLCKNGILGAMALIFLLLVLFRVTRQSYKNGSKLPMLLFIMILCRCLCESYLASLSYSDPYFLLFIFLIVRDESRRMLGIPYNDGDDMLLKVRRRKTERQKEDFD